MSEITKPAQPQREAIEAVFYRNTFYDDGVAFQKKTALILTACLAVSILVNLLLFSLKPEVRVIAIDPDGSVIPVFPLIDPMVTQDHLTGWVTQKVVKLHTYDFRNWQSQFQEAKKDFTSRGWSEYGRALEASNTLELVRQDNVLVSAVPLGAPVILQEGDFNGRYAWRVKFPLLVTYEGASSKKSQSLDITVVVTRASTIEHRSGLVIEQFISRDLR